MEYPLGQGYFHGVERYTDTSHIFIQTRILPVLQKHFKALDAGALSRFAQKVTELFGDGVA